MPATRPLDALRASLRRELDSGRIFHAQEWGNPRVMTETLRVIKREFGGNDGGPPTQDVLQASLLRFVSSRQVANFTELKCVCYGITVPVGQEQRRIIDSERLFDTLLTMVQQKESQPKQFRRCYQGLLNGYFGFDLHSETKSKGKTNWGRLRGYLGEKLQPTLKAATRRGTSPDWLKTLHAHRNLLTEDPCSRYAKDLSRGEPGGLKEVCAALGIAGNSWVWQDALMAYVRLVCEGNDASFHKGLPGVLKLVNGQSDLQFPQLLATRATAMSVIRYCNAADKPEHAELRDTCVHWIGNPWLKRAAWDAQVDHEPARQMVDSWLKRRLIKDFFELLAEDGAADLRRLDYWLKWEPHITDMWFVLGSDARSNQSAAFRELRKRMAGRDRILGDNNPRNNAFVMRVGQLLVIEFGVTGNATYIFAASDFRTSLEKRSFTISELKQRALTTRLSHLPNWESRFDYELKKLLQSVPFSKGRLNVQEPASTPQSPLDPLPKVFAKWGAQRNSASTPIANSTSSTRQQRPLTLSDFAAIRSMCVRYGIELEDNRAKKGALWVLIPDRNKWPRLASLLDSHGFRYTDGRGFWLKDEG